MIKKYRQMKRIINILKIGLNVESLDEIEQTLILFYRTKGVSLNEKIH